MQIQHYDQNVAQCIAVAKQIAVNERLHRVYNNTLHGHQVSSLFKMTMAASKPPRNADGTRWCSDCEAVDETIDEAMKSAPAGVQFILVEIPREEWKVSPGPHHLLRASPYNVAGIPTLLKWDANTQTHSKKITDPDMLQLELMTEFFSGL